MLVEYVFKLYSKGSGTAWTIGGDRGAAWTSGGDRGAAGATWSATWTSGGDAGVTWTGGGARNCVRGFGFSPEGPHNRDQSASADAAAAPSASSRLQRTVYKLHSIRGYQFCVNKLLFEAIETKLGY